MAKRNPKFTDAQILEGIEGVNRISQRLFGTDGNTGRFQLRAAFSKDVLLALVHEEAWLLINNTLINTPFKDAKDRCRAVICYMRDVLDLGQA